LILIGYIRRRLEISAAETLFLLECFIFLQNYQKPSKRTKSLKKGTEFTYNSNLSQTSKLNNFVIFQYFSIKFDMYIPFIVLYFFVSLCSYQI